MNYLELKDKLTHRLSELDADIGKRESEIAPLQDERGKVKRLLAALDPPKQEKATTQPPLSGNKSKGKW
jgi:hypothetical protein